MGYNILNIGKLLHVRVLRMEENVEVTRDNETPVFHCTSGVSQILRQSKNIWKKRSLLYLEKSAKVTEFFEWHRSMQSCGKMIDSGYGKLKTRLVSFENNLSRSLHPKRTVHNFPSQSKSKFELSLDQRWKLPSNMNNVQSLMPKDRTTFHAFVWKLSSPSLKSKFILKFSC